MENKAKVEVIYCPICTFPLEYCEFSENFRECKKWLALNHPEVYPGLSEEFEKIRNGEAPAEDVVEEEKKGEGKAVQPEQKPKKVKFEAKKQVIVSLLKRGKTKNITKIEGLKDFNINLKDASKVFRKHFASGCAVVEDSIEIQGEVVDEVIEKLLKDYKEVTEDDIMISDSNKTKKSNKGRTK